MFNQISDSCLLLPYKSEVSIPLGLLKLLVTHSTNNSKKLNLTIEVCFIESLSHVSSCPIKARSVYHWGCSKLLATGNSNKPNLKIKMCFIESLSQVSFVQLEQGQHIKLLATQYQTAPGKSPNWQFQQAKFENQNLFNQSHVSSCPIKARSVYHWGCSNSW